MTVNTRTFHIQMRRTFKRSCDIAIHDTYLLHNNSSAMAKSNSRKAFVEITTFFPYSVPLDYIISSRPFSRTYLSIHPVWLSTAPPPPPLPPVHVYFCLLFRFYKFMSVCSTEEIISHYTTKRELYLPFYFLRHSGHAPIAIVTVKEGLWKGYTIRSSRGWW